MAGEKIFIADKPTLDEVNGKLIRDYMLPSEYQKVNSVSIERQAESTDPEVLVDVTGSGLLYYALGYIYSANSSESNDMEVIIDGVSIFNSRVNSTGGFHGFVNLDVFIPDGEETPLYTTVKVIPKPIKFNSSLKIQMYPFQAERSLNFKGYYTLD